MLRQEIRPLRGPIRRKKSWASPAALRSEARRLVSLKPGVTPELLAQSLCDGARGTNQALPPIPIDELHLRYRQIIEAILFGAALPSAPRGNGGRSTR